ncbi:MAG: dihydrofolate reductase [Cyclobacteriaceae bacterium]|nr:dihydrofolate reductase [Cyclobacteriaceae bacterium]
MKISMIAAVAKNRVIGKDNDLAWNLPDDMKFFMQTTSKHVVLMGRKNWESIPDKFRPLPNRINIVMSRNSSYPLPEGVFLVDDMQKAFEIGEKHNESEFFIIGGEDIYRIGFPFADRLYITEVNDSPEGDAYFPEFDKNEWKEISREHHPADERHAFSFDYVILERK